jgi:serine/threonine protein kinase/tetratricopeptide (TPR) repeat protein
MNPPREPLSERGADSPSAHGPSSPLSASNSAIPSWHGLSNDGPAGSFAEARSLKRELLDELRADWERGTPRPPEKLLDRWPGKAADDPDVASLLFEDFCQRQKHGDSAVNIDDYEERFPEHKDSLRSLIHENAIFKSLSGDASARSSKRLALPSVGDQLFDFRLRKELGRGAFARVFLAEQAGLADRPVVLKVSAIDGDEPQTLAQLQHTNIVPIYSVHEDARAGLRAVCMPYFGGDSLSRVLRTLWAADEPPSRGMQLAQQVTGRRPSEQSILPDSPPDAGHATFHVPYAGFNFVQAAVWITAGLAEALQHAHDRGILHRDIKPSNILLAADGQPMLLDFNLAQQARNGQAAATLGGTVAYMAPEHLRALAARDPALARLVDHRADLYSLGMVFFEMLAGQSPFDQSASYSPVPALIEAMAVERSHAVPSLRRHRPDIPWSLESILRKCLAPEPGQRYQQAADLAEDLHCFLEDRPLRHAPELSWRERVHKWTRRHPRLTTSGTITAAAAALLVTAFSVLVGTRSQLAAARQRVIRGEEAEALQLKGQFEKSHQRALCLVNTHTDLSDYVHQGLVECKKALAIFEVLEREDWQAQRYWQRLPAEDRPTLAEDVRELLLVYARAEAYLASSAADRLMPRRIAASLSPWAAAPDAWTALASVSVARGNWNLLKERQDAEQQALRKALTMVDRASTIAGLRPSAALWEDRADYLARLGDTVGSAAARAQARALPPVTMRDHYELARMDALRKHYPEAVAELQRALDLNPHHHWTWFQLGVCHEALGKNDLALGDYSACIALWPEFAWSHFNRGRILNRMKNKAEAHAELSAALRLDPNFASAYYERGVLDSDLGRAREALADLDRALALGLDTGALHVFRGAALERLGDSQGADAAFARAWERGTKDSTLLVVYGFAVCGRLPKDAEDAFKQAIQANPRNARAFYGLGMLAAVRQRQSAIALLAFTRALEIDPSFFEARRARANVLAHQGQWALAQPDIDWCVKVDPSGETLYQGACVYALLAEKSSDRSQAQATADHALMLLEAAFERGYGRDQAAADSDLAGIQHRPEFEWLVSGE